MEPVYIAGIAMTQFGRHLERSIEDLAGEALSRALEDAGASVRDIGAAFYAGITSGLLHGQYSIAGQVTLKPLGVEGIPIFNLENACATGSSAVNLAIQSVRSGVTDVALALGVEKMNVADKVRALAVFGKGLDVAREEETTARLLKMGEGIDIPKGSESERPYSRFMAIYASLCRWHMKRYGTTQRQMAAICSKNHQHSVHNPWSQYRQTFSIEEVLAAPPIVYPLTLPMCAPVTDGAAATIICSKAGLRKLNASKARSIQVLASVMRSSSSRTEAEPERHLSALAAHQAYEIAGVEPSDIDVAEVHDASAMGEILQAEFLGLARFGEGGPCAEHGDFTIGGRIPINPSGGLESKGHPLGATGIGQLYELVTQLRGEAGQRQVEGARIAIQENGGGFLGIEEATVAIHILSRVGP